MRWPAWTARTWPWPTVSQNLGLFLLGIWLVAMGVLQLFHWRLPYGDAILPALAIASGLMLIFNVRTTTLVLWIVLAVAAAALLITFR